MADVPVDCDFPIWGLLPKKETGVVSFLNKNPNYDGRDTVIAIFDSGVDPAATGLQVTPDGSVKVIERFDCSGCGDVDTSTVIKKVVDGCITGLTGRKLKIPETWENPSGEWRVGILHPFSLYPTKLKERIQEHRKAHLWDVGYKPAFAEANKKLQDFENETSSKGSNLNQEEKLLKEELEARVDALQTAEKKYFDVGPTYDCVLFHDGKVWRACIDTSESGDLASGPLLGEYSVTHEHSHLTALDEMTVSINVHDEGLTLEVVGMCSTHGTHVAAIASGYYPDNPDLNGVAPGAKIVSLTIGDSRLGSMETGTALVRACIKVMELSKKMKIDVINMSYGEHAHWSNTGRVGDVICSVVNRYGISWVVSAGNHGPALGTVGAPPDIAQPILIGVGAYVSPEMMSAAYSMRARLAGGAFSWSSRGPAADGALGVACCAPGGAVAAVARFTLRNSQLMNGTSMAAPHVAGVVAALISGLKAKNLPYSPYSIKRALENSATYLNHVEPWAQGCGLVNIEKAFEHLTTYYAAPERDVTFNIQCGAENTKGILLRPKPDDPPKDINITIEPQFLQDHNDEENKSIIPKQIGFGLRMVMCCDASWVSLPSFLDLSNVSRPIIIRVDTSGLPAGPHFTSILAYDSKCVEKGPVFRVALTVLVAEPPPRVVRDFAPADIARHFVIPPEEATWGCVRASVAEGGERGARLLVHVLQLAPRRSCRAHDSQRLLHAAAHCPAALTFPALGGVMMEIAIAKYWANIGTTKLKYTVEFHGVKPDCGPLLVLTGAVPIRAVNLKALKQTELQPHAVLRHVEPVYRPSESKIVPLTPRDVIPPSRQIYQLINTYNFHITKATEVSPIVTALCDMLYESEFESQMWMLYNSCKQLMAVGDAYPSKYSVKLEKGEYVIRLNVRHDQKHLLERLQETPLRLQQRLTQPVNLDLYSEQHQALIGGKKFSNVTLGAGNTIPIYFTGTAVDKLSRGSGWVGGSMSGTVWFSREESARKSDGIRLQYIPPERRPRDTRDSRDKDKRDDYCDARKEFATTWIPKLEGEKLEQVYEEILEKYPGYLGAHVAYLQALDSFTDPKKLPHANEAPDVTTAWCEQLITIADLVIKEIDQDKLLAYLGMKNDTRADANKIKQEQDRCRAWLVEALSRRGAALCRLRALGGGEARTAAVQNNLTDLLKFCDLTDTKVIHYGIWHYFTLKQWGRAVKLLWKLLEERPSKEVEERLVEAYKELGWTFMAKATEASLPIKYPANYRPF